MTLDCPFRNPLQPRVISVRSYYLTSYGYLHFYWIRFTACSIQQLEFHSYNRFFCRYYDFLSSNVRSSLVGGFRFCCLVPAAWRCLSSRMPVSYIGFYWEMISWTANLLGSLFFECFLIVDVLRLRNSSPRSLSNCLLGRLFTSIF